MSVAYIAAVRLSGQFAGQLLSRDNRRRAM